MVWAYRAYRFHLSQHIFTAYIKMTEWSTHIAGWFAGYSQINSRLFIITDQQQTANDIGYRQHACSCVWSAFYGRIAHSLHKHYQASQEGTTNYNIISRHQKSHNLLWSIHDHARRYHGYSITHHAKSGKKFNVKETSQDSAITALQSSRKINL